MQIYFEDGKLINSKLLPIIPNFIINAEDGVTSCINQLDNINSVKPCAIIYTNSIFAPERNTFLSSIGILIVTFLDLLCNNNL